MGTTLYGGNNGSGAVYEVANVQMGRGRRP